MKQFFAGLDVGYDGIPGSLNWETQTIHHSQFYLPPDTHIAHETGDTKAINPLICFDQ
jgi:hypothetical protein